MVSEDVRERVVSYIRHQAGKPPEAIAALVADSQGRLIEVVSACDEAAAARSPGPGEWSMGELVRHVLAAERSVTTIVETLARSQTAQGERRAGSMADDAPYGALLDELRTANERMLAAIRALPADADVVATATHPFFGELNCREWAAFQRVHDEDHIQHARKIAAGG
ncbi:MAG: DinB family protein [Dehalococcoidia bacterium]